MTRHATILDVARAASVSKSTVSLVLRGSPRISAATAERVRAAIRSTGYVYNRAAARLRSPGAGMIGLVINDLQNPFFTQFAASMQGALSSRGYATVVSNASEDASQQDQAIVSMIEHRVSALVVSPAYGDTGPTFDRIARAGVPAVQVVRQVDDRTDLFPFASFDYRGAARRATRHLYEVGAGSVAFVGGVDSRRVTHERMSGYAQAVAAHRDAPRFFPGEATRRFGREAARKIVGADPPIDAALCFNDLIALGMCAGLAEMGVTVGREFRIAGIDDLAESAECWPGLTSVRCDTASFGHHVARVLLRWLRSGERPQPEYRARTRLIPRVSTCGCAKAGRRAAGTQAEPVPAAPA